MRFFVKLMILVVIAALAGPFFIRGPDGVPLMALGEAVPDWQRLSTTAKYQWSRVTGEVKSLAEDDGTNGKTRVYRTQDSAGNWVYSNEAPADGNAEVMYVDPDVNIIPATPPPPPAAAKEPAPAAEPAPSPFLPGNARRAMDGARDVQGILDERARQMEDATRDNQ